jgi:serine/threonine-protein kinase
VTASATATPTATPCPIAAVGGFGVLLRQNDAVAGRIGCPTAPEQGGAGTIAEQPFVGGSMIYFQPRERIFAFLGRDRGDWFTFDQAELEPLPTAEPQEPPPGLFVPQSGFGRVWANFPEVREALGFATAPERGLDEGALQNYARGTMLYSRNGAGRGPTIYVIYDDGAFERYDDPNQ